MTIASVPPLVKTKFDRKWMDRVLEILEFCSSISAASAAAAGAAAAAAGAAAAATLPPTLENGLMTLA